ncbi:MAG TPA: helix-turn-helix domain-containing protein [Candidatus Binatia bacterium]|nr:helix-turn-helix domain-containing protein [Candidatus Binatia bacterium]
MPRPRSTSPDAILAAAFARFTHYGFRRTSMEDIADEAGVSRAALYLHFRNKEEIFRSLSQALHEEALAGARAALAPDGPLAARLAAALEAKNGRFLEVGASPHGMELIDESSRLCGDVGAGAERRFLDLVADAFEGAERRGEIAATRVGLAPREAAELLVRSARGLKQPGTTGAAYRKRVDAFLRVFLSGLGAVGARSTASARAAGSEGASRRSAAAARRRRSAGSRPVATRRR